MKHYLVQWEIELDAETPQEAAEKALHIQRDVGSSATVFDVFDSSGDSVRVDGEDLTPAPESETV